MKAKVVMVLIILHFMGCSQHINERDTLIIAKKETCKTCQVILNRENPKNEFNN